MTTPNTTHTLAEISAEIMTKAGSTKKVNKSIKQIIDLPIEITAVKILGKGNVTGYLVTAHLPDEAEKSFSVRVYSAQPKRVLASIIENDLLPMSCRFVKIGGGYALAE